MAADYRITFAADQIAKKNFPWLRRLISANCCPSCLVMMEIENNMIILPGHCGHKINALWKIVRFTRPLDLSPGNLMGFYSNEDLS